MAERPIVIEVHHPGPHANRLLRELTRELVDRSLIGAGIWCEGWIFDGDARCVCITRITEPHGGQDVEDILDEADPYWRQHLRFVHVDSPWANERRSRLHHLERYQLDYRR